MKTIPPNADKIDKLDPMTDTQNYAAGNEGEDILEREDNDEEMEEETLTEDLDTGEEEDFDESDEEDDEDDGD
ncbi:MAG TPA: hypothetical protein VHL77_13360 [Ferruginibacter sp.]|nr:hypothetical protein [Ferruginibacter sp.]